MSAMSMREFIHKVYSRYSEPTINSYAAIEADPKRKEALEEYDDLSRKIEQTLQEVWDHKRDIKDADMNLRVLYELKIHYAKKVWI